MKSNIDIKFKPSLIVFIFAFMTVLKVFNVIACSWLYVFIAPILIYFALPIVTFCVAGLFVLICSILGRLFK